MSKEGQPLKSWVRTLNEVEGMLLLDVARPGMQLDVWRQEANAVLSQDNTSYRTLLIKMVERILLDTDGERIVGSPYLSAFQGGWPDLRRQLFLVRYGLAHPWTALAAHEILAPARLSEEEEPLVELSVWDAFVSRHIDPKIGESSRKKTRSTLVSLFKKLGCLEATGSTRAPLKVCTIYPAPMAFGWVVGEQLRKLKGTEGASQAPRWAALQSDAAALFGSAPEYARRSVEAAVAAKIITRVPGGVEVCAVD